MSNTQAPAARRRRRMAVNLAGPAAFVAAYLLTRSFPDATWALLAGSLLSVVYGWAVDRRLAPMPLALGLLAAIFGGLSLFFHDLGFIKAETSIRHAAIGLFLLGGLAFGFNTLKLLAGEVVALTDAAWWTLTLRYGLFNLALAALNFGIWQTQSDAVWAVFKFPVLPLLHLGFLATQLPLIARAHREVARDAPPARSPGRPEGEAA